LGTTGRIGSKPRYRGARGPRGRRGGQHGEPDGGSGLLARGEQRPGKPLILAPDAVGDGDRRGWQGQPDAQRGQDQARQHDTDVGGVHRQPRKPQLAAAHARQPGQQDPPGRHARQPSALVVVRSDSAAGDTSAPAPPCTSRATISMTGHSARPQATDATAKMINPMTSSRRRPVNAYGALAGKLHCR
jgi:hypothetical protein